MKIKFIFITLLYTLILKSQTPKEEKRLAKALYYITCNSYNGSITNCFEVCKELNILYKDWDKLLLISPKVVKLYESKVIVWNQSHLQQLCRDIEIQTTRMYYSRNIYSFHYEIFFNNNLKQNEFILELFKFELNNQILFYYNKYMLDKMEFTNETNTINNIAKLLNSQLNNLYELGKIKFNKNTYCKDEYIDSCTNFLNNITSNFILFNENKIKLEVNKYGISELIIK